MSLEKIRAQIDAIDDQIIDQYKKRLELVLSLAPHKKQLEDINREQVILERALMNRGQLSEEFIKAIFAASFQESKRQLKDWHPGLTD